MADRHWQSAAVHQIVSERGILCMFKQIVSAFIVGGIFAVVGQSLISVISSLLGGFSMMVVLVTLLVLGMMGGVLFISGIYQKIEKIGAFGAILPLCGLVAAIGGIYSGAKINTGSTRDAVKEALLFVLYILGIGTILAVHVGVIAFYTI